MSFFDWLRPNVMPSPETISERVATLTLRRGDLLVVKVAGHITAEQAAYLRDQFSEPLPSGVKVFVHDGSIMLSKVTRQKSKKRKPRAQ